MKGRNGVTRHPKVLVVDDDFAIRELLQFVLEEQDYAVRGAASGREALDLLRRWRPELIVLDLMMPGMDGRTFLEERRRAATYTDIPVLIVSAVHDLSREAQGLPAVAVYEKPLNLDELLVGVRSLIAQRSTETARASRGTTHLAT